MNAESDQKSLIKHCINDPVQGCVSDYFRFQNQNDQVGWLHWSGISFKEYSGSSWQWWAFEMWPITDFDLTRDVLSWEQQQGVVAVTLWFVGTPV